MNEERRELLEKMACFLADNGLWNDFCEEYDIEISAETERYLFPFGIPEEDEEDW